MLRLFKQVTWLLASLLFNTPQKLRLGFGLIVISKLVHLGIAAVFRVAFKILLFPERGVKQTESGLRP
jgi:hypothetical protein